MMDDLRTKLRQTSRSFGEPGYTLDRLDSLKRRREQRSRFLAIAVAFVVVALSGSLLWGAFVGVPPGGRVPEGSFGIENGRISFVVGEYGGSMEGIQLATAEADGSDPQTLIDGVPEYLTGGWSPDGSTMVFSRAPGAAPDGHIHLWRMNVDGTNLEQLTDGEADDLDAQWSPDGTQILFRRGSYDVELRCNGETCIDAAPAIFVMNGDGSGLRRVTVGRNLIVLGARWSPDGSQIVFIADTWAEDRDGEGIYLVRSDGTALRRIVPRQMGSPQWSPDGQQILFQFGSRLVSVDSSGSGLRRLVEDLHRDVHFQWSPDGKHFLYVRPVNPGRANELWVAAADGSDERLVAEDLQWPDATAAWSPDSKLIAFTRDGDIWTVDVAGGAERQVTDTPTYESLPAWGSG